MSTPPLIPPGMHTVTPHIVCAHAEEAMAFYRKLSAQKNWAS